MNAILFSADGTAPEPDLSRAFEMELEHLEPIGVGSLAIGGVREYRPVHHGRFSGGAITADVIGGGETLFRRADGSVVVEAAYYIRDADGFSARAFGNGYHSSSEFDGTRLSLLFEADQAGPLAHLAQSVFIGERLAGSRLMSIFRII